MIATEVKPDMVNEWMAIQKNELNPVLKKAGITKRTVSRAVFGNTNEFISISPMDTYAVMDDQARFAKAAGSQEAWDKILNKMRRCVVSSRTYITTRLDDMSNVGKGDPPPISVSTRRRVASGKMQEYESFMKAEVIPAYNKAKVTYANSRRGFGSNSSDIVGTTYYNKMADLDAGSPLTKVLGESGVAKLTAKGAGLSTIVETVVRRRVPELSY